MHALRPEKVHALRPEKVHALRPGKEHALRPEKAVPERIVTTTVRFGMVRGRSDMAVPPLPGVRL
ncbi:hypothetical protein Shyhy02_21480 [Streptomyces hygroscopicus subsp. hygroscopicus]|nr:hypothetical protein Shyhy02_21480 [Streptomyces hygroscopicus subsp. hygroscopicus]